MSSLSSSMLLSAAIRSQDDGKGIIISSNVERSIKEADILLKNGNLEEGLKDLKGREEGLKWIVLHVFHSDYEVREQVIKILGKTKLSYEIQGVLWKEFKVSLSGSSTSFILRLTEGLQLQDGAQSLRILSLFIQLLGLHLRNTHGLAVINALLSVIEKGYRGTESQRIASFHVWKVLIDNFSLPPSILSSSKRTKLIVRPLASLINAKTEEALKVKMEVWWYFILKLGNDISSHVETVFVPFIGFLFGTKKEGFSNAKLVDSPIKKFANIDIMSLDAFYLLMVLSSKNEDCTLPPCYSIQKPGLLTKKNLTEHYKTFFLALEKSSELIKFGNNRSLGKFKLIFDAISDVLHLLISENEEPEKIKEIVHHFCRCLQAIIYENKRKPHTNALLFSILEKTVTIIPHRFMFYKNNSTSILQIFLDIVFHTDFLQQAKDSKSSYMDIFSLILDKGSVQTFILIQKVTQKAFDDTEGKKTKDLIEIWQNIWRTIVARMKNHVEQTREINEANDDVSHKLNTVKSILLFPIQYLMGITSKEFWKSWGDFYSICIQSAEVIRSYKSLELESFICLRANKLLKKDCELFSSHQVFIFNNYCRITTFITSNMSLGEKCSFDSIRPNVDFMSELVALASKSLLKVGGASVGVSYLCTSLINLLSVLTPGLIRPVIESTSNMITTMLGSNFMTAFGSGFETQVEHLVDKIVNLIQARYTGEYYEDFLNTIKALVLCLLTHSKKPIKSSGHRLWQLTFAHTLDENKIPSDILSVLRENLILSSESSMSISSLDSFTAPNLHTDALTKNSLKKSPIKTVTFNGGQQNKESLGNKSPANPNKSPFSALKGKRNKSSNINDDDTQDFVPIISDTNPKNLVLTEHQKEILKTRKDDIPALYSELSRDDSSQSQILSSFTERGLTGSVVEVASEKINPDENSSTSQSLLKGKNEEINDKPLRKRRSSRVSKAAKEDEKTGLPSSKILKENLQETKSSNSSSNDSTETVKCTTQEDVVESSQSKPTTIMNSVKSRKRKGASTVTNPEKKRVRIETEKNIGKENKKLRAKKLNEFGESPLQIAIKRGNLSKVTELLKNNAQINHRCYANWTPLHDSIKDGENAIAIIKVLLEHEADVNATGGEDGNTPLHESVLYSSKEVVQLLINKGADPNLLNKHALKPIDLADPNIVHKYPLAFDWEEKFGILRPITDLGISKVKQKAPTSDKPEKLTTRRTKRMSKTKKSKLEGNQNSKQTTSSNENDELESKSDLTKDDHELTITSTKSVSCVESEIKIKIEAIDSIFMDEEKIIENEVAINMCCDMLTDNEERAVETTSEDSANLKDKIEVECTEVPESMNTTSSEIILTEHDAQVGKLISLPKPIIESGEVVDSIKNNINFDSSKASVSGIAKTAESPLRSLHKSRAAKLIEMSKAALVKKSDSVLATKVSSPVVSTPSSKPWQKFAPSPNASPTASILKRRYSDFSPSNRSRKVQFLDPPVSERVEIPRKNRFYDKSNSESEVSYSYLPSPPVEDTIVYSALSACQEPVSCILRDLTNKTWLKTAEKDLKEKSISTIGDLSKLKKSEAIQLKGLKPPVLVTLRDTLRTFEKSYEWPKKANNLEEKEDSSKLSKVSGALAPFVEVQTPEEEEKDIQEIYERPSPSPTEDAETCTKGVQTSSSSLVPFTDKCTQSENEIQLPSIRENASQTPSKDYESQGTQSSSTTIIRCEKSLGTDTISLESKINELLSLDKSKRWEIANKILASLQNE